MCLTLSYSMAPVFFCHSQGTILLERAPSFPSIALIDRFDEKLDKNFFVRLVLFDSKMLHNSESQSPFEGQLEEISEADLFNIRNLVHFQTK